jgi:hypothetical protein
MPEAMETGPFWFLLISFLGSLPPGAISLYLMEVSGRIPVWKSLGLAALAAGLELIHLWLAFLIHQKGMDHPRWLSIGLPVSMVLLIWVGIRSWNRSVGKSPNQPIREFRQFISLNLLNLAAIPFWLAVFQGIRFQGETSVWLFPSAGFGGFLALSLYATTGTSLRHFQTRYPQVLSRILAMACWGLAVFQGFTLLTHSSSFL